MILLRDDKMGIELLQVEKGYILRSVSPRGRIIWQKHHKDLDVARREFYTITEK